MRLGKSGGIDGLLSSFGKPQWNKKPMKIFRSEIERVIEDDYSFKALRYILRNTDYIGGLGSGEIDSRS